MKVYPLTTKFKITSLFGERDPIKTSEGYTTPGHQGIDFGGGIDGKDVVACENGVVKIAKFSKGCGNYVWLATDSGYGLIYQHLSTISVKVGQRVTAKEKLGTVGSTGMSTGPHLHFGVATNSEYAAGGYGANNWINPVIYLGMQNAKVGQQYDGSGTISGYPDGVDSVTNNAIAANSEPDKGDGYLGAIVPSGEFYQVTNIVGTLGDWLYGRRYRILIDIGNGKTFDVSELRCEFEIIKSAIAEPNQSILTIYNLSPEVENQLIQNGQRIIIEAGYNGSQYGMIFSGNIIQPLRYKENGVDYKLTLVSMDTERYLTYGLVGVALVAQQSARDAVDALLTKSTYKADYGALSDTTIKYPRGKVMFGMTQDFLKQIANSENATFYTDDGKVNIVSAVDVSKGSILSFGPQNGLIGSPVQNELGIECDVLLNPQVKLNSLFHIDNKKIQNYRYSPGSPVRSLDSEGVYRVVRITHRGDTRGDTWQTHIEAISQAGLLPGMMSSASLYNW